jgi:hypothetical protein
MMTKKFYWWIDLTPVIPWSAWPLNDNNWRHSMRLSNILNSQIEKTFRKGTRRCMSFCQRTGFVFCPIPLFAALTNFLSSSSLKVWDQLSLTKKCVLWKKRVISGYRKCLLPQYWMRGQLVEGMPTYPWKI